MAALQDGQPSDSDYSGGPKATVAPSLAQLPPVQTAQTAQPAQPAQTTVNHRAQPRQTVFTLTSTKSSSSATFALQNPSTSVGSMKTRTKRCAACVYFDCSQRMDCPGSGGRARCRCGHDLAQVPKGRVRISEAQLVERKKR